MARTKDPKLEQRRREQIMTTARQLLTEGSFATLTLSQVAKRAGLSKGLLTYYFGSKEQLVVETIRAYHAEQNALLRGFLSLPMPASAKLRLLVDATLPSQESVVDELRFQVEIWSFAKAHPEALEGVQQSYFEFRRACEQLLDDGIAEGSIHVEDKAFVYRVMHGLIDGLSFQLVVEPDVDMVQLRDQTYDLFHRLLAIAD